MGEPEKLTVAALAGKVKASTCDELKAALLACGPQELDKILACDKLTLTLADLAGKVNVSTPDELKAALLSCDPQELEKVYACLVVVADTDAPFKKRTAPTQDLMAGDGVSYVIADPGEVDEKQTSATMCAYC